jgi:hypothetical protein
VNIILTVVVKGGSGDIGYLVGVPSRVIFEGILKGRGMGERGLIMAGEGQRAGGAEVCIIIMAWSGAEGGQEVKGLDYYPQSTCTELYPYEGAL